MAKNRLIKKETFSFKKDLNMDQLINDITRGINKAIQDGITKTSTDINGKPFKVTSNPTPLLDKGKLWKTYIKTKATKANEIGEISMNMRDRAEPSIKHNEGIGYPKRNWFGIGSVANKIAEKLTELHIRKAFKK